MERKGKGKEETCFQIEERGEGGYHKPGST